MMPFEGWTRRRTIAIAIALAIVPGVFGADYVTGSEVAFSLFFLVPVAVATWGGGRSAGVALSLLCAAATVASDVVLKRYPQKPFYVLWHLAVALAFYLIATLVIARLRRGLSAEQDLRRRLEGAYEQLDAEMRTVGSIQRTLLPAPALELPGCRVAVSYEPSTRAGGDYYDFFELQDGRVGLLIADVSGHGASAAVVMAMMRVLFHRAELWPPERTLALVNRGATEHILKDQFVTACYAVLDPRSGEMQYALAGHLPPLVLRSGSVTALGPRTGPPLGVVAAASYERSGLRLERGDVILLYTDGITEARDPAGRFFGEERLAEALARAGSASPEQIRDAILRALRDFTGGTLALDDVTLVAVQVTG